MPVLSVYEYSVIRLVPSVLREEFVNVGVILLCAKQKFIAVKLHVNEAKIKTMAPDLEMDVVYRYLAAIEKICAGKEEGGLIGKYIEAERFRWITATRSTMIQPSKVHPGLCYSPKETISRLFEELVL